MISIIPFADHEIGYECVKYLLEIEKKGKIIVPYIVTTKNNDKNWWPKLSDFENEKDIKIFEDISVIEIKNEVDVFLLLSWKFYMGKEWIGIPKVNTFNLHYSLLPKYRGTNPVNWAIINGENETGITFHEVSQDLDAGRIIIQESCNIENQDSLIKLLSKLNIVALKAFKNLVSQILSEKIEFKQQETTKQYFSKRKFDQKCELDLEHIGTLKEHLNLLKGVSFKEDNPLAYSNNKGKITRYFLNIYKSN